MPKKRKTRRVQYEPHLVVSKILNNDFLRTLVYVVFTAKMPVPASEIAREVSRILNRSYHHAYVSTYLRRLEKWGVIRPYKDPNNGKLLWWRADTKTADMLAEEIGRQEMKQILQVIECSKK